jgi:hypothetical protein
VSKHYGWCFTNDTVVAVTFASSGLNMIADWTFGLIPIFIVKDLQMPKKQKRLVAGILGFGNIACVATIVRMPFILNLYKDNDFLYETIDIALWSNVEPGVGIAAACIATLRPLLQRLVGQRASGWFSDHHAPVKYYGSEGQNRESSGNSYALRDSIQNLRPDRVGTYTQITSGSGQGRDKKDPMVTGREIRDLYEASDLKEVDDPEQQLHLSSAAADPARDTPTNATPTRGRTGGLEIQKSVVVTMTEEIDEVFNGSRSATPIMNWLHAPAHFRSESRASSYEPHLPPLDISILASLGEQSRGSSPQRTSQKSKDSTPGTEGDPFALWR